MQALRRLSLVNVRITAAPAFEQCTVDIDAIGSYLGRSASKLSHKMGLTSPSHGILCDAMPCPAGPATTEPGQCAHHHGAGL